MNDPRQPDSQARGEGSGMDIPRQKLLPMQILAVAMLVGVASFLVVVLIAAQGEPADSMILSLLSVGMLGISMLLALIVPPMLAQKWVRQIAAGTWQPPQGNRSAALSPYDTDAAKLLAVYQTTMIITLALIEGAAFFGCIALLVERHSFTLGVVAAAILIMMFNFPTAGGVRAWLERQLARVAEMR